LSGQPLTDELGLEGLDHLTVKTSFATHENEVIPGACHLDVKEPSCLSFFSSNRHRTNAVVIRAVVPATRLVTNRNAEASVPIVLNPQTLPPQLLPESRGENDWKLEPFGLVHGHYANHPRVLRKHVGFGVRLALPLPTKQFSKKCPITAA